MQHLAVALWDYPILEENVFLHPQWDSFPYPWLGPFTSSQNKLLAQLRYQVKTTHERCGPFSLVAMSHEVHTVSVLKDFLSLKQCKT